jgi:hypothetical protein
LYQGDKSRYGTQFGIFLTLMRIFFMLFKSVFESGTQTELGSATKLVAGLEIPTAVVGKLP